MATLKKLTRMGADVRQIARLLQAKAPEGHMLAYITPDEAKLLKSQGGSGKEHEDTGVPSFENEFSYDMYGETATPEYTPQYQTNYPEEFRGAPTASPGQIETAPVVSREAAPSVGVMDSGPAQAVPGQFQGADRFPSAATPQADFAGQSRISEGQAEIPYMPSGAFPAGAYAPPEGGAGRGYEPYQIDTAKEPSATLGQKYSDLAKSLGIKEETLGRLGIGGFQALLGAYQTRQAREDAESAKREQQGLAAPYQQKGAELQRAAQAGELTPASEQQLKAVQAQASQAASSRGGVGAQQSQAQIEAFRNQLLQQQYDYGLKLSGIGDQIALGAIKTGMQADQYVNQLTSNYYNNIARTLYGAPPQTAQQPTQGAVNG
jgi:hypothetical protein